MKNKPKFDKHDKRNFGIKNKIRWEFPDLLNYSANCSSDTKKKVAEFKRKGAIQIRNEVTINAANHIISKYLNYYHDNKGNPAIHVPGACLCQEKNEFMVSLYNEGNGFKTYILPFADPIISKLLFDDEVSAILYNYFNRQAFYTRHPILRIVEGSQNDIDSIAAKAWHTHHYHPIVMMLNLNDLTMEDTHVEVACGTHKIPLLADGRGKTMVEVLQDLPNCSSDDIFHGVGKIGTLNIFDSRAYHRANILKEKPRSDLHLHITTGNYILPSHGIDKATYAKFKRHLEMDIVHLNELNKKREKNIQKMCFELENEIKK